MDLIEDKPRQHPKPVPFSQNTPLQPIVPEVSLIMQDSFNTKSEKKNDSFSGTEFQTYNSWRWKHINSNTANFDSANSNKFAGSKDCCFIKDKYCTSDIEKRKNEILYGDLEEPRRPLPPRTNPVLPTCIESFFSSSLEDLNSVCSIKEKKQPRSISPVSCLDSHIPPSRGNKNPLEKELENSEKLYNIISEQNKQMQVLQNQIEQLLKLQEVKDNQIEQLLKSQESKERKIKQLLQSLESKEKEIEQLTNSKLKQDSKLEEVLKMQDNVQKENLILQKKLNEIKPRDIVSVGIMASVELADASTNTSFENISLGLGVSNSENLSEEHISVLRDCSNLDEKDKSLSLHSSDLPVIQENAPTPQSSIHVDIQDFPDSSDDSESETGIPSNSFSTAKEVQSNPLGYTFYNNVLTQLKDIIQNSGEKENKQSKDKFKRQEKVTSVPETKPKFEDKELVQSYHDKENIFPISKPEGIERFSDEFQNFCIKETSSPSDISLKINALAVKYLKQEQIPELGLQNQIQTNCQHDVTIYNVTNLSLGSMRYLDRYQMLPLVKDNQKQILNRQKHNHSPSEFLRRKRRLNLEENIKSSVGNILDISSLNQQPKLL